MESFQEAPMDRERRKLLLIEYSKVLVGSIKTNLPVSSEDQDRLHEIENELGSDRTTILKEATQYLSGTVSSD